MKSNVLLKTGVFAFIAMLACATRAHAEEPSSCNYDRDKLKFAGDEREQARCLLRKVHKYGKLDQAVRKLPYPIEEIVGEKVEIDKSTLRAYLKTQGIKEENVGGNIDLPLSRGRDNDKDTDFARYFVIHDTSTIPKCEARQFDADINAGRWRFNMPDQYKSYPSAHVFITRDGQSSHGENNENKKLRRPLDFSTPWRATKLDLTDDPDKNKDSKGLCCTTRPPSATRRGDGRLAG
jgi:hypothetical protein